MGMTVDASDFEKGLAKLVQTCLPESIGKGMFRAGSQLVIDANEEPPYTPFDEGHLRGSGKAQGAGGLYDLDPAKKTTAPRGFTPDSGRDWVSINVGFNKEYAARWHELTPDEDSRINWTLKGSGRKYLETKLIRYREDYIKIVAKYIENLLNRKGTC